MDYYERTRFDALERSLSEEPEPRDDSDEESFFVWSDIEYERAKEDEVLCKD